VYEINTWVWLHELGQRLAGGGPTTLADVPAEAWDAVCLPGVDAVWLMGVWARSPAGIAVALADEGLMASFAAALPGVGPDDVVGSPYCVRRYEVDDHLGGRAGLAAARAALAERGVRLVLDDVPNHVAPDHPWTVAHPDRFIVGDAADLAAHPDEFVDVGGNVLARGRDPFFPPWPDVVQLNAFSEGMRAATVETLVDVGDQCDGVRCDMAMLLLNDVFARTWGDRAGPPPDEDFWVEVIGAVRRRHPDLLFMAEAYWDLEPVLLEQGFDHCYDKRLYDRLAHEHAGAVRAHLVADPAYQRRTVRFLENHDEPRAAAVLDGAPLRAASVALATLPGATLWHEGQLEGRRTRIPVFLRRRPDEAPDADLRAFLAALLAAAPGVRTGDWRLLDCHGWPDNDSCRNLLAWCWDRHVVVVNLSPDRSQAVVPLPWGGLGDGPVELREVLGDAVYERDPGGLSDPGLFVDLAPWSWHVLERISRR
jgi:hypothetical protein